MVHKKTSGIPANDLPTASILIHTELMRIALISPYSRGPQRGNITTVDRISRFLAQRGIELLVLPADALLLEEMEVQLASFAPQLIHGFHARFCGGLAQHLAAKNNLPFVI
ncbi:MAG: hypothetical protein PHH28_15285, partial [Desulfuromonadaceae bacterium]|nr:hypothetical protein [Desulfuromonadaceae bacterium]